MSDLSANTVIGLLYKSRHLRCLLSNLSLSSNILSTAETRGICPKAEIS